MDSARRNNLWIWRGFWFVVIVGGTLATFPLVRTFSEELRRGDAQAELAQMQKMLVAYQERNKVWPAATTNEQLVLAFVGRLEPRSPNAKPRWYLEGTNLHFRPIDPETPGAQIIDPWGRPYVYSQRGPHGGESASYVLFSAGADGRYSQPIMWAVGSNGAADVDRDNICVFSDKR